MSGYRDTIKQKGASLKEKGGSLGGRVKGMVGKGEKDTRRDHVSTPISSLRDPASFAPPPKHVAAGGPVIPRPSQSQAVVPAHQGYTPQSQSWQEQQEAPEEAHRPYQVDTTGLSTAHLPPPPVRGAAASTRSPPPVTGAKPPPPKLPPRLPPRATPPPPAATSRPAIAPPPAPRNAASATPTASASNGYLNQSSLGRLSSAGVSVPGLGIGGGSTSSPSSSSSPPPPAGTTFAQKQAALQTASAFSRDPRSVSMSDARAAASTADSFRRRHGDQVAAGLKAAEQASPGSSGAAGTAAAGFLAKKKPAPPPPPPKRNLNGAGASTGAQDDAPPPVPLGTKPRF